MSWARRLACLEAAADRCRASVSFRLAFWVAWWGGSAVRMVKGPVVLVWAPLWGLGCAQYLLARAGPSSSESYPIRLGIPCEGREVLFAQRGSPDKVTGLEEAPYLSHEGHPYRLAALGNAGLPRSGREP